MISIIREVEKFNGKLYVRQGLASDVVELKATCINAVGASSKNRKFHTGDVYKTTDTNEEYEFEEGSNQWYLQL